MTKNTFKLVLSFLVAICLVTHTSGYQDSFSEITPGQKFLYDYDSQIISGTPGTGQYAGFRLKSKVQLAYDKDSSSDDYLITLQLKSIKSTQLLNTLSEVPQSFLSDDVFSSMFDKKTESELARYLELPVKFVQSATTGAVHKVYSLSEDPFWSLNIKKAMINLLQTDLRNDETDPFSVVKDTVVRETDEYTIAGRCPTRYLIEFPNPAELELHVIRSPALNSCWDPEILDQSIAWNQSVVQLLKCPGCADKLKPLHPQVSISQVIQVSDTRQRFFIREVNSQGSLNFVPFLESSMGSLQTHFLQKLVYESEVTGSPNSLQFDSAQFKLLKEHVRLIKVEEDSLRDQAAYGKTATEVKQMLRAISESFQDTVASSEELENYHTLLRSLRRLPSDELLNLIQLTGNFNIELPTQKKHRLIRHLADIIPAVGTLHSTKATILFIRKSLDHQTKDMMLEEISQPLRLAQMLRMCTISDSIAPETLSMLLEILKDFELQDGARMTHDAWIQLYETGWLVAGSMANVLFVGDSNTEYFFVERKALRNSFVEETSRLFNGDKLYLGVAVADNSGLLEFLDPLKEVIQRVSGSHARVDAVYALKKLAHKLTSQAISMSPIAERSTLQVKQRTLLSLLYDVYRNNNEETEIRIAAYKLLMIFQPETSLLNMLLARTFSKNISRGSKQVFHFVFCHMKMLAEDKSQENQFVTRLRLLLSELEQSRAQEDRLPSVCPIVKIPLNFETHNFGGTLTAEFIFATSDVLPASVNLNFAFSAFGKSQPLVEVSMSQKHLIEILSRYYGFKTLLKNSDPIWERVLSKMAMEQTPRDHHDKSTRLFKVSIMGKQLFTYRSISPLVNNNIKIEDLLNTFLSPLKWRYILALRLQQEFPTPVGLFAVFDASLLTSTKTSSNSPSILPSITADMNLKYGFDGHFVTGLLLSRQTFTFRPVPLKLRFEAKPSFQIKFNFETSGHKDIFSFKSRLSHLLLENNFKNVRIHNFPTKNERTETKQMKVNLLPEIGFGLQLNWTMKSDDKYLYKSPMPLWTSDANLDILWFPPARKQLNQFTLRFNTESKQKQIGEVPLWEKQINVVLQDNFNNEIFRVTYDPKELLNTLTWKIEFYRNYWSKDSPMIRAQIQGLYPEVTTFPYFSDNKLRLSQWLTSKNLFSVNITLMHLSAPKQFLETRFIASSVPLNVTDSTLLQVVKQIYPTTYARCLREAGFIHSSGYFYTPSCALLYSQLGRPNNFLLEHRVQRDSTAYRVLDKFHMMFKSYFSSHWFENVHNQIVQNSDEAVFIWKYTTHSLSPFKGRLTLTDDRSVLVYPSVYLPLFYPKFLKSAESLLGINCRVRKMQIRNSNGELFTISSSFASELQINKCPVLLTKDCSLDRRFAVILNDDIVDNYLIKRLQITYGDRQMEVVSYDKSMNRIDLKIDGKIVQKSYDNYMEIPEDLKGVTIKRWQGKENYLFQIYLTDLGLTITAGEPLLQSIDIQSSALTSLQTCGLCGNSNGDWNEPSKAVDTSDSAVRSYIVPSNTECQRLRDERHTSTNSKHKSCTITTFNTIYSSVVTTFSGVRIKIEGYEQLLQKVKKSTCPMILLESKNDDFKILFNRNLDLSIDQGNLQNQVSVKVTDDDKIVVTINGTIIADNYKDLPSIRIHRTAQRVVILFKKVGVQILRSRQVIKIEVSPDKIRNLTGVCKDMSQWYVRRPEVFFNKFTVSTPVCLQVRQSSCVVGSTTFTPFYSNPSPQNREVTYLSDEILKAVTRTNCPIVLAFAKYPTHHIVMAKRISPSHAYIYILVGSAQYVLLQNAHTGQVTVEAGAVEQISAPGLLVRYAKQQADASILVKASSEFEMVVSPTTVTINMPVQMRQISGLCSVYQTYVNRNQPLDIFLTALNSQLQIPDMDIQNQDCRVLQSQLRSPQTDKKYISEEVCRAFSPMKVTTTTVIPNSGSSMVQVFNDDIIRRFKGHKCPILFSKLHGNMTILIERWSQVMVVTVVGRSKVEFNRSKEFVARVDGVVVKDPIVKTKDGIIHRKGNLFTYKVSDTAALSFGTTVFMENLLTVKAFTEHMTGGLCTESTIPEDKSARNALIRRYLGPSADPQCQEGYPTM